MADLKGNIKNFNSLACQFEFACDTLEEDLVTPVAESVEEARAVVDAFDKNEKIKEVNVTRDRPPEDLEKTLTRVQERVFLNTFVTYFYKMEKQ